MPRSARRKSGSNLYHVMLRGNDHRQIFHDEEDNEQFLAVLRHYKAICGYQVYAYCLMGNHVHLLLRVGQQGEDLGQIFRRIGAKYVFWYNEKYERIGHLFQDRYKSEAVEDDQYLLTALRYIHQNPVKAGLVGEAGQYAYSSFGAYVSGKPSPIVDTDFILGMMGEDGFAAFHAQQHLDQCLDMKPIRPRRTVSDAQARATAEKVLGAYRDKPLEERRKAMRTLAGKGLSYRQISNATGESMACVQRALAQRKP